MEIEIDFFCVRGLKSTFVWVVEVDVVVRVVEIDWISVWGIGMDLI